MKNDLAALEKLARAALPDAQIDQPDQCDAEAALSIAADAETVLALIALARATPQHSVVAPDPVVEANRQLLLERSRVGVEKYGTTLADAGLSRDELVQHALEETLDLANYLQALLKC